MELYERLEQQILDSVTPELEAKYFVASEFFSNDYDEPVIGSISEDGYGDTALIYALHNKDFPETESFESAVKYYEDQKCFKVFHLTEGLKVMFSHKQMPGCDRLDFPELSPMLDKWWTAWCNYARLFYDEEEVRKEKLALATALENAVKKYS